MRALRLLLALALCWSAPAFARRPARAEPPPVIAEALAVAPADRLAAIALLEGQLTGGASDPAAWAVMVHAGEQRRLAGDAAVAKAWFDRVRKVAPTDDPAIDGATLGLALINAQDGLSGNIVATLQLVSEAGVPDTMNADRFRLLALDGLDQGSNPGKVKEQARKALQLAGDDAVVAARVRASVGHLLGPAGGPTSAAPADGPAPSAEADALRRAREAQQAGRSGEAARIAQQLLDTWPDTAHKAEAESMIRRSAVGSTGVAGKVGVLLPRTGEYAAIGKRIEQVVRLANERAGTRMQLVFLDAHGDPAATKQAVEDLVVKEQVVAILGPLLKEDVMEAARAAQSLGVPMVALSQAQDPASVGDYVFRGFLPLEQQVKALVDHAMGVEGMRSFATLHPRSSFGDHAADLFRAEVERRGGKVIREADYDEDATSFFEQARIIGAKDYKARAGEFAAVKRAAAAKGVDPSKAVLPPQIDFDAIFIPDSWQRAALVASSLAYEEFPVGSFRPNRHAARVPLLGLNAWNDPRIVDVGGAYVQHAIFVDAFAPQSDLPGVQQFVQDHDSSLGRKPGVIDALAWDATRLLGAAVTAGGDDRGAVRDELLQARISGPLTGGDRFGSDREVDRKLVVLTIRGGGIRIWHPPELSPEGPEGPP